MKYLTTLTASLLAVAAYAATYTLDIVPGDAATIAAGEKPVVIEPPALSPGEPKPPATPEPPIVTPDPPGPPVVVEPAGIGGMVYTRIPRTTGVYDIRYKGQDYRLKHPDIWDAICGDTDKFFSRCSGNGQLVYLDPDGKETIIHDCLKAGCLPQEASFSLDNKKIIYSVMSGEMASYQWRLPQKVFLPSKSEARIYVYDLETGERTAWPHIAGTHDQGPIYLPDGKVMFMSNRHPYAQPWIWQGGPSATGRSSRMYVANEDGTEAVDVTPHEVSGAGHPILLSSGRVAYGSRWWSHNLPRFATNGALQGTASLENSWTIATMLPDGSDHVTVMGGHRLPMYTSKGAEDSQLTAWHFVGEMADGKLCAANYYRGNNNALGHVACWTPEAHGLEGPAPVFRPSDFELVADWGTTADGPGGKIGNDYSGKVGFPEGLTDGSLLLTKGTGACSKISGPPAMDAAVERTDSKIGCDLGLYRTTKIPSKHPDDLQVVVDSPDWHEYGARVARPRIISPPQYHRTGTQLCEIINSDAGKSDSYPYPMVVPPADWGVTTYKFNWMFGSVANGGNRVWGTGQSEVVAIRFWEVIPNLMGAIKAKDNVNITGNRLALLGDVPLLADGSFRVQLPCDVPYVMAGIDAEGRALARDMLPQSLRPGEQRQCLGCHLHGEMGRPIEQSLAYTAEPVVLETARPIPTWEADIRPLFSKRCGSCHQADAFVNSYDALTKDWRQSYVPADKRIIVRNGARYDYIKYGIQTPLLTKYVSSTFARESLLYCKAAGVTLASLTGAKYPEGMQCTEDHPTDMTAEELDLLAQWIDGGSQLR